MRAKQERNCFQRTTAGSRSRYTAVGVEPKETEGNEPTQLTPPLRKLVSGLALFLQHPRGYREGLLLYQMPCNARCLFSRTRNGGRLQ